MGLLEVVVQVEAGIEVTVSQGVQVPANKNSQGSNSSNPPAPTQDTSSAFDKVKGKCIRCMKPGHTRPQCKASITPVPEQTQGGGAIGQNNGGNTVCRLAKCMFGSNNDTHNEERSRYIG